MTLIIAHRGASLVAKENTLEAMAAARRLGADWVELDVRRAADGVIVVHHDAHLADGRMIGEVDADSLADDVPNLAQALEACAGLGVNIEIKNLPADPDFDADHLVSDAVAGLARAYLDLDKVLISSFNIDSIDRIKAIDGELPTAWLAVEAGPSAIDRTVAHGHDGFHPYHGVVDAALVDRAHQQGLVLNAWTVDDEDRMVQLAEMGVDGIVTNDVAAGRRVIDSLSG